MMTHSRTRTWKSSIILAAVIGLAAVLAPGLALAQATADAAATANPAATADATTVLGSRIDMLWVLISASLVFFMQAGFLAFEVGAVRRKNTAATALKNVGDWVMISLVYFMVGYGLMYGTSLSGFIGTTGFLGSDLGDGTTLESQWSWAKLLFQMAFCGTAATIVSGAMAERTTFKAYLVYTFFLGALIYPIFGHWVWNPNGWLHKLGYVDFAGSSAVHIVGGMASIVGIKMVGPRLGRYAADGTVTPLEVNSSAWSALGTIILWFCWWGFNGGSTLALDGNVIPIILKTNISAATAAMVAFFHANALQGGRDLDSKFLGGALGGLVAVTASCHIITPVGAFVIGAIAGILHNYSYELVLRRWRLDDVVAAVPVHGFCGLLGIIAVPLWAQGELPAGNVVSQLLIQCLGAAVAIVWTGVTSFLVLWVIKATIGIRVSPMHEIRGTTIGMEAHQEGEEELDPELEQVLADPNYNSNVRLDDY